MALLTAIGTIVLAVFAVVTALYARKAFQKQSQEVGLLLEQNKRDADERRRGQAARVFLGAPFGTGLPIRPYARNASDFPIYDAQVWYVGANSITGTENLGNIMPGETRDAERAFRRDYPGEALKHTYLTFRDAESLCWIRAPGGLFWEQQRPTAREEVADAATAPLRDPAGPVTGDPQQA